VLGGAMISLWVGCWRSQVPSVNSPECVEEEFCELRPYRILGSTLGESYRTLGWAAATPTLSAEG
jgi:hypothetical protein